MKWIAAVPLLMFLIGCSKGIAPAPEPPKATSLANGLQVVLRPIEGARSVALVVSYAVGERDDPEGASGMAHLMEHLLATCATSRREARDVDTLVDDYPDGFNAQTGEAYTVVATVFQRAQLEEEIADAAARMTDLRIEPSDLEREKARLDVELANMTKNVPMLAVQNFAAQAVAPPWVGAQRGGVPEQIALLGAEKMTQRWSEVYRAGNATLVLAGDFDPAEAKSLVERAFADVPRGQAPPTPDRERAPLTSGTTELPAPGLLGGGYAAVAFPAPAPSDPNYAGFLMLAATLQSRAIDFGAPKGVAPVQFAPLDRPEVLTVSAPNVAGEDEAKAAARLQAIVERETESAKVDAELLGRTYGFLLGLDGPAESDLALNPYGVAFGIARRRQMGLDSAALAGRINSMSQDDLVRARAAMLEHVGRAIVRAAPARR